MQYVSVLTDGRQCRIDPWIHGEIDDESIGDLWQSLGADIEELDDDLERQPFGLRHLERDEDESKAANESVEPKHAGEADGAEHDGQAVGDNNVADPERQGADGDAEAPDPGGEDLGAEDVWDGAESHDEAAEVDDDGARGERRVERRRHGHHVGHDEHQQGADEHRDGPEEQAPAAGDVHEPHCDADGRQHEERSEARDEDRGRVGGEAQA